MMNNTSTATVASTGMNQSQTASHTPLANQNLSSLFQQQQQLLLQTMMQEQISQQHPPNLLPQLPGLNTSYLRLQPPSFSYNTQPTVNMHQPPRTVQQTYNPNMGIPSSINSASMGLPNMGIPTSLSQDQQQQWLSMMLQQNMNLMAGSSSAPTGTSAQQPNYMYNQTQQPSAQQVPPPAPQQQSSGTGDIQLLPGLLPLFESLKGANKNSAND